MLETTNGVVGKNQASSPGPRKPDNLDRLLGLLESARSETKRATYTDPGAPYRALLAAIKRA
jgi:hypothetical protein